MIGPHDRKRFSLQAFLSQPAPPRPWWQRILLPIVGLVLMIVGIVGAIMPVIPGAPLIPLGFPLFCCFNRTAEDWARRHCLRAFHHCRFLWHRFHAWRQARSDHRRNPHGH